MNKDRTTILTLPFHQFIIQKMQTLAALPRMRTVHVQEAHKVAWMLRRISVPNEHKSDVISAWQSMMQKVGKLSRKKCLSTAQRSEFHGARDALGLNDKDQPKQVRQPKIAASVQPGATDGGGLGEKAAAAGADAVDDETTKLIEGGPVTQSVHGAANGMAAQT